MAMNKKEYKELYPVLRLLKTAQPTVRKSILAHLDSDARRCVYGCVVNCLRNKTLGKHKRSKLQKSLKRYKKNLRNLSSTLDDNPKKRELLVQSGGALPAILGAVLPLIASLFTK